MQDLLAAMISDLPAANRRVLMYLALADSAVATVTLERVLAGETTLEEAKRLIAFEKLLRPQDMLQIAA